jgi:hypothetical protein
MRSVIKFVCGLILLVELTSCANTPRPPIQIIGATLTPETHPTLTRIPSVPNNSPTPSPSATASTPTHSLPTALSSLRGTLFALLVNNRLIAARVQEGQIFAERALEPIPTGAGFRAVGHLMALSRDGKTLFVLAPGEAGQFDTISAVDVITAKVQASDRLPDSGGVYRSLALGRSPVGFIFSGTVVAM